MFTNLNDVSTFRWNDFSSMNGGYFPPHKSHDGGFDIDVKFDDESFERRGPAEAERIINLLNSPAGALIDEIYFTLMDAFRNYIANKNVLDPTSPTGTRTATSLFKFEADHADHFHIRLRPQPQQ